MDNKPSIPTSGSVAVGPEYISEAEFISLLSREVRGLVRIHGTLAQHPSIPIYRRLNAFLVEESSELEDFLDDFDARYNRRFATLGEVVASLHGFSVINYTVRQISRQLHGNPLVGPELLSKHKEEIDASLQFTDRMVKRLTVATVSELEALCGPLDAEREMGLQDEDEGSRQRLTHDLIAGSMGEIRARIAREAGLYIGAIRTIAAAYDGKELTGPERMAHYVAEICNEEQCRFFETKLHNIQSRYDTFIKNSSEERNDPELGLFRAYVGITLGHLKVLTLLIHFYERHEDDIRSDEAHHRVAEIVDKETVLDRALNFALYYANAFMEAGLPIADSIISRYTTECLAVLAIPDGVVLHARPAALISKIVAHHGTPVQMQMGEEMVYAGSLMRVIMLAGQHTGHHKVTFTGDAHPIADLQRLFEHRLGEDGLDDLPPQLDYLKR